ncbi:MAG: hypothetical protein DK304_000035 [Chloroflexi bacterium]|jgi:hypothetical protein|nr:MAG: hypothetical protein DK304_000035 [Chloroflexota bacterium]
MKIEGIEQAIEVTLLGLSTAFVGVIGLMGLIFVIGRLLDSEWFKTRIFNYMGKRAEEKGMAAALGVGLLVAQQKQETPDDSR